jgi:hypothetical protein
MVYFNLQQREHNWAILNSFWLYPHVDNNIHFKGKRVPPIINTE